MNNSRKREKKQEEVKLLLLGAGESGKTTFLKQMKIINLNGYTTEEKMQFQPIILSNIKLSMKALVHAASNWVEDKEEEHKFLPDSLKYVELFADTSPELKGHTISQELCAAIAGLWKDPLIQTVWEKIDEWDFLETAPYFFDTIEKIASPDYVPVAEDILRCRVRTTGISELLFSLKNESVCRMVDVGGQRSERRKWIHCFQSVTAVLFFVSLSEYDQKLHEATNVNRMHESVKLFEEVCNCKWFASTSVVLFLNKNDLFKEKIQKINLNICFPDYNGGNSYQAAADYIKSKFLSKNMNKDRCIYIHFTCATDTDNIRKVYDAVQDILLDSTLAAAGFGSF